MSSPKVLESDIAAAGNVTDQPIANDSDRKHESPKKAATCAQIAVHRSRPGFPHRVQAEETSKNIAALEELTLSETEGFNSPVPFEEDHSLDTSGDSSFTQSVVSDHEQNTIHIAPDDDEAGQETDRLLDQLHLENQEENKHARRGSQSRVRTLSGTPLAIPHHYSAAVLRHGVGTALSSNVITYTDDEHVEENPSAGEVTVVQRSPAADRRGSGDLRSDSYRVRKNVQWDPELLIEGVLFRANYLGSTQLSCDGRPTKTSRMVQAEEAVSRIKAPAGESQPSTPVDLCISTEKIMVLNTGTKDTIMDPSLRSISYIADIGDLVVLMTRRGESLDQASTSPTPSDLASSAPAKIICHVFDSADATIIAQSIGQAFQVAYAEFLRANGLTDDSTVREVDYQQVLNSQQIYGNELATFTRKDAQKEIEIEKAAGEILGLVLVESGWGSLIPTVVVANMLSTGAAARSGLLNIGDQLIAVNGLSLVGLPLATSQNFIGSMAKGKRSVQLTVVPCAPVVEVQIRRPDTKFQLGFSVQNGIICSLLRGGIAERGGVRVGHRIIEINDQSVVAVRHEQIVSLLASSVGEIRMKTMPTAMFRLLTGQESPTYI